MPQGVEHIHCPDQLSMKQPGVRIPLMPQGVEHQPGGYKALPGPIAVRIPLMPQGVEHNELCLQIMAQPHHV